MLESTRSLSDWCCKNCGAIYKLWRRIVKQDELNGDLEFITIIGFRKQIVKILKETQKKILQMERSMWKLQKPHIGI